MMTAAVEPFRFVPVIQPTPDAARWSMGGYARQYPWSQCKYCGRASTRDCPAVACLLCGTVQCFALDAHCKVCLIGWIPGWSRPSTTCGYARCDEPAVATIRKKAACAGHAMAASQHGAPVPLYLAERIVHRNVGDSWEFWRLMP